MNPAIVVKCGRVSAARAMNTTGSGIGGAIDVLDGNCEL